MGKCLSLLDKFLSNFKSANFIEKCLLLIDKILSNYKTLDECLSFKRSLLSESKSAKLQFFQHEESFNDVSSLKV